MADIDLGALKYKVGLDISGLDKQIKDVETKIQQSVSKELSFKLAATELGGINSQLSDVLKKIMEANKQTSKIGNTGNKKLGIEKQIESLVSKIEKATADYTKMEDLFRNLGRAGGSKGMQTRQNQLEKQKGAISDMIAELNRLKSAYDLTSSSIPRMAIADERELNLLRRQYELEIAKNKEIDKQIAKEERKSRKLQADQNKYLSYLSTQSGMAVGMSEGSADEITRKIAAIQKRIEALNDFKATVRVDSNQAVKAEAIIAKLEQRLSKLKSSSKTISTDELLNINPTSINQANALIAELTSRRNVLNTTDANYSKTLTALNDKIRQHNQFIQEAQTGSATLERTNKSNADSSKKFTVELEKQNRMMREFVNTIKTYAGFYFFRDMFNELVNIRGEFELQQVSLRAIIQDARKADEIFNQIKGLAVVSPFQFKDLVGYTKQLSAFQIPVNELYGTMKSLADVSSGLGVDMGRIILAYGQIRSAGVLRGQELRQLTEAGIPALEQLRKKLEQVRGVAVSTDDVFSAISKREIPFDYIKEMFTTMTSEGGSFYKMQEKQAASLKGMVSNLADAYQIMMNDIGEANDSTLKGIVGSVTTIMNNWRMIGDTIVGAAAGYGVVKVASMAYAYAIGKENSQLLQSVRNQNAKNIATVKAAQSYRLLTAQELEMISLGKELNITNLQRLNEEGLLTKELALQLVHKKQLTAAQKEYLVMQGIINKEEMAIAERTILSTNQRKQSLAVLKQMSNEYEGLKNRLVEMQASGASPDMINAEQKNIEQLRERARVNASILAQNGQLTKFWSGNLTALGKQIVQQGILTEAEIKSLSTMRARNGLLAMQSRALDRASERLRVYRASTEGATAASTRFVRALSSVGLRSITAYQGVITKLGVTLRGLGTSFLTAIKGMISWQTAIFVAIGAIYEYFAAIKQARQELDELNRSASQSFSEAFSDLTENVNKIFKGKNLESAVDLKNIQYGLEDILKKYGDIGEAILLQANMTDDTSEKIKIMKQGVDELAQAYKNGSGLVIAFNEAANHKNNIFDSSFLKSAQEYSKKLNDVSLKELELVKYKAEYVRYAEAMVRALNRGNESQKKLGAELQGLIDNGAKAVEIYNKISEARENSTGIAMPSSNLSTSGTAAYSGYDEAVKSLKEYEGTFKEQYDKVEASIEAYIRDTNPKVDFSNLSPLMKKQLKIAINQFLVGLKDVSDDTKRKVEDALNIKFNLTSWKNAIDEQVEYLSPDQLKRTFLMQIYDDAESTEQAMMKLKNKMFDLKNSMKDAEPDSENWKLFREELEMIEQLISRMGWGMKPWQEALRKTAGSNVFDGIISSATSTEDAIKDVAKEYQNAQSEVKNYTNAFAKQGIEIKNITRQFLVSEAYEKLPADLQNLARSMAGYNETIAAGNKLKEYGYKLDKKTKTGEQTDPEVTRWKERIRLLQSAFDKYRDLKNLVGEEEAKIRTANLFGEEAKVLNVDLSFDSKEYLANYDKAIKSVESRGKAGLAARAEFGKKKAEEETKFYVEEVEKSMKKVETQYQRYRNKYNFYEDILGITGNKDLALDLAIQYSGDAGQMASSFTSGLYDQIQSTLSELNITMPIDPVVDKNSFTEINTYVNSLANEVNKMDDADKRKSQLQNLIEAWRDYFGNLAQEYANNLAQYGDYYDKVNAIQQKYAPAISFAESKGDTSTANALKQQSNMDIYKLTTDYQNFFGAIEAMSKQTALRVANDVKRMLEASFRAGTISAKQYQQELKRVEDQISKMFKSSKSDLQTYLEEGLDAVYEKRYNEAEAKKTEALNKQKQAMADINYYTDLYNKAMAEGDKAAASSAQNSITEAQGREKSAGEAFKTADAMSKGAKGAMQAVNIIDLIVTGIYNTIKAMQQIIASISNLVESTGGDSKKGFLGELNQASEALGVMNEGVKKSWDSFKSGDIGGAISNAISMPMNVIATFNKQHDDRLQKHIEAMEFEAKKLTNIYNMVQKAFEHLVDPLTIEKTSTSQVANLKEQIRLQEDMMDSEAKKKKTDEGKMEDYRKNIAELRYELKYYMEELAKDLYSIDLTGWASTLSDALVDAFSKGENAADVFKTTVGDLMRDVVKNWMQKQYIEAAMKRISNMLFGESGLGGMMGDGTLEPSEIANLNTALGQLQGNIGEWSKIYQQLNEAMGGIMDQTEESTEGINNALEGVTEDTMNQAIGYLNGMRAEMIVQSGLLRQLIALNGGSTEGTGGVNMTTIQQNQLRTLESQLASVNAIRDAILSVISISPTGGSAMKVIISN